TRVRLRCGWGIRGPSPGTPNAALKARRACASVMARMIGCPRLLSGVLVACLLAVAPARADMVYELAPNAGGGASDNVSATGQHYGDTFTLVGGNARLRYDGLRVTHVLSYGLAYSKYMQKRDPDTLSNSFGWLSTITPSPLWTLSL